MDIVYQYYNEIVLAFSDYEVSFHEGIITIQIPDSRKPFDVACEKIRLQIEKIANILEPRNKQLLIRVQRSNELKDLTLEVE